MRRLSTTCLLILAACGRNDTPAAAPGETGGATPAAAPTTGTVIEIRSVTDEKGSRFEPAKITAHPGDVLRFTLVSGVHNVSWPVAGNPAGAALPATGDMLQLPGQTYELPVTLPAGTYHFQCDPHAALGMVGELDVQ